MGLKKNIAKIPKGKDFVALHTYTHNGCTVSTLNCMKTSNIKIYVDVRPWLSVQPGFTLTSELNGDSICSWKSNLSWGSLPLSLAFSKQQSLCAWCVSDTFLYSLSAILLYSFSHFSYPCFPASDLLYQCELCLRLLAFSSSVLRI